MDNHVKIKFLFPVNIKRRINGTIFRNLEAHEIMEQYLHLASLRGRISNVVFMGMGEPLPMNTTSHTMVQKIDLQE